MASKGDLFSLETVFRSPVLAFSICLFSLVYAVAYLLVFRTWKGRKRHEAASCCISFIHGTVVTALAAYDVYSSGWELAAPNSAFENGIMEYSVAYFVIDLAHYVLFVPDDYLFILHHIATSSYMISCRYFVGYGAVSVCAMLAVGECTSPFQNVWTLCRMGRETSATMKQVYEALSPFFTVLFTVFRVAVGPALVWNVSKFYFAGGADGVIPRLLVYSWMGKSSLALVGSLVWVYKLWTGLIRFYARGTSKPTKAAANLDAAEKRRMLDGKVD